jgi:glycosyltransferase involved in cell wall biosynthesis
MGLDSQNLDLQYEKNTKPLVAVWMVTYNHESYIAQAIESILLQKTNYDFKIYIGEDCSNDTTSKICQEYKKKHPDKIELILHEKNIGANANGIFMYEHCFKSGAKYIALCEGDDYWTDPLKLQKQVDFLSANLDFGICFHKTEEINLFDKSKNRIFPNINNNTIYTIEDYILNNWTATCSIVFTYKFYKNENWFNTLPFGDLGLVLIIMKNSNKKAMVLKDIMGAYRVHKGGVHGNLQQNSLKLIEAYKQHLVFGKIIKEKLLHERIYSKYFLKKKIQTYEKLYQLYKNEDLYIKGLSSKIVLFFLKIQYKLLY